MNFKLPEMCSLHSYSFAPYPSQSAHDGSADDWNFWWIVQAFKRKKMNIKLPGTNEWIEAGSFVAATIDDQCKADLVGRTLIPVPGHDIMPANIEPMAWPGLRMSMALAPISGRAVVTALRRTAAIQQSSAAPSKSERATVEQQVASLAVSLEQVGDRVMLVDDTLTGGTTCMGCSEALRRAGYKGDVRVFTIGHVIGADDARDFHRRSTITWIVGQTHASRS